MSAFLAGLNTPNHNQESNLEVVRTKQARSRVSRPPRRWNLGLEGKRRETEIDTTAIPIVRRGIEIATTAIPLSHSISSAPSSRWFVAFT
jgi:hypothetical protein